MSLYFSLPILTQEGHLPRSRNRGSNPTDIRDRCVGDESCHNTIFNYNLIRYVYNLSVAILNFRHKGLERFFTRGNTAGIQTKHAARLRLILGRLHVEAEPRDMALPGLRLHPLTGDRKGT